MQRFDEKAPVETVVLTFNFALGLAAGETLTGVPSVTISTLYGGDVSPASIANGSAQRDPTNTKVLVPVQGGLDQNDYVIIVESTTTNPLKSLAWPGILPVRLYPSTRGTC